MSSSVVGFCLLGWVFCLFVFVSFWLVGWLVVGFLFVCFVSFLVGWLLACLPGCCCFVFVLLIAFGGWISFCFVVVAIDMV